MVTLRLLLVCSAALLACSDDSSDSNVDGIGGASTTASSANATMTVSSGTTTSASTGGDAAGGGGFGGGDDPTADCPDDEVYFIEHNDEGPTTFESGCENYARPTAAFFPPGKAGGPDTRIDACAPLGAPKLSLPFDAWTPLVATGDGPLGGTIGESVAFSEATITFDAYGEVGEPVKGSYVGTVVANGEVRDVSGVFTLCRIPDLPPAP